MIENLEGEVWKPVKGYEDRYMVSNLGRLKSLFWKVSDKHKYAGQEHLLSPGISEGKKYSKGHLKTVLSKNGKTKCVYIHRIVYETFIGDFKEGYCIDHKDGNPLNNNVENLHLVTPRENVMNPNTFKNFISKHAKKVIIQETGQIFDSIEDTRKYFGVSRKLIKKLLETHRTNDKVKFNLRYYEPE